MFCQKVNMPNPTLKCLVSHPGPFPSPPPCDMEGGMCETWIEFSAPGFGLA